MDGTHPIDAGDRLMAEQTPGIDPVPTPPDTAPAEPVTLPPEVTVPPIVGEDTIRALEQRLLAIESNMTIVRLGVVTATSPLSVTLGGSSVAYTSVKATGGATFTQGDTVQCLVFGNDLIIQGKVGGIDVRDWEPGDIKWSRRSAPTAGWLLCNGQAFSSATYPELFAALGATTVPDLRGRAPIGAGQGSGLTNRTLGATTGAESHTLTSSESGMPTHNHPAAANGGSVVTGYFVSGVAAAGSSINVVDFTSQQSSTGNRNGVNASSAHNNMQPSIALNAFIKT